MSTLAFHSCLYEYLYCKREAVSERERARERVCVCVRERENMRMCECHVIIYLVKSQVCGEVVNAVARNWDILIKLSPRDRLIRRVLHHPKEGKT